MIEQGTYRQPWDEENGLARQLEDAHAVRLLRAEHVLRMAVGF
jgi:hypothetical protein